ncbi:MAG: hypothetical protein ACK4ND_18575 [Cytophagaceae bacterium]
MVKISSFKAWRFNPKAGDIKDFILPQDELSPPKNGQKINSAYLSYPDKDNLSKLKKIWGQWKEEQVIFKDSLEHLYICYHTFF